MGNNELKKKHSFNLQNALPFMGLIVVAVILEIMTGGQLLSAGNISTLVNEVFIIMIGASAMVFIMSQGCLDLSMMANMAVSCAFAVRAANINPMLALPVGIGVGSLIGFINGFIHAKCKINSFITTIGMSFILSGLVVIVLDSKGSMPAPIEMIKWNSTELRIAVLVIIAVIGYILFEMTRVGRTCKALGSNEEAARQSGINVEKFKILVFTFVGSLCGLLGFFSILRTGMASPNVAMNTMFNILIAVLLGGISITGGSTSRFRAAIIGSLTMAFLSVGMTMAVVDTTIQQLVRGVIFIMIVYVTYDRKGIDIVK